MFKCELRDSSIAPCLRQKQLQILLVKVSLKTEITLYELFCYYHGVIC